jgi:hypothetical protein
VSKNDELVPDADVRRELGNISVMSLWRLTQQPEANFPKLIKLGSRNYRARSELERFKKRLIEQPREASR